MSNLMAIKVFFVILYCSFYTILFLGPGLLDPDCVSFRSIKVRRDLTWEKFNARVSEYFGCPDSTFRIWIFKRKSIRTNDSEHDVWRPEPIEEEDVERPISQVRLN